MQKGREYLKSKYPDCIAEINNASNKAVSETIKCLFLGCLKSDYKHLLT